MPGKRAVPEETRIQDPWGGTRASVPALAAYLANFTPAPLAARPPRTIEMIA